METNGKISIMPKPSSRPVEVSDMLIDIPAERLGAILILDGHVNEKELILSGKSWDWLNKQLAANRIADVKKIFIAGTDKKDMFFFQYKNMETNDHK
jgi:uncharacterized membrane protein YcaP (DUF421 family)